MRCYCFHITPHLHADDPALMRALARDFLDFWATFRYPARMLSVLHPASFETRLHDLDRARRAGGATAQWRAQWLLDMRRTLQAVGEGGTALTLDHFLVVWVPDTEPLPTLTMQVSECFAADVRRTPVPPLPGGPWDEGERLLVPTEPGDPYLAIMVAHNIMGTWDLLSWQRLFALPFSLTLALDVQTPPKYGWQGLHTKIAEAYATLDVVIETQTRLDCRTRTAQRQLGEVAERLEDETMHQLGYLILVHAPTPDLLATRVRDVEATIGAKVETVVLPGVQRDLLQFFTPTPARQIAVTLPRRNTLSTGVAYKTPFVVRRSAAAQGTLLGVDTATGLPVHYALRLLEKEAGHLAVWGKTGFGKTVFQQVMLNRLAVEDTQIRFLGTGQQLLALARCDR